VALEVEAEGASIGQSGDFSLQICGQGLVGEADLADQIIQA
jgi:hypothetical protein